MEVQHQSFSKNPEETERMLRQLAGKVHAIADRVKRIGSYTLYMELTEIGCNVEKICSDALMPDQDLLEIKTHLPFMQQQIQATSVLNRHV